jgi:hypothetical protein
MQALAWLGFTFGFGLLLLTGSSVIKIRPLLRVGYIATRSIARTLKISVSDDPHPDDPLVLTKSDFDEAVRHLADAGWTFERRPDEAWPHFRGWRVNYEAAVHGIAAHLDLPPALWSGPRKRHGQGVERPRRPANREPGSPNDPGNAPRGAQTSLRTRR